MTGCREQRAVDRHFAGTLGIADESALRDHLPGCVDCRDRYHRRLLLESVDPRRPGRELRLGRGLGLRARSPRRFAVPVLATALAGVAAVWVGVSSIAPAPDALDPDGLSARGPRDAASHVFAYRVGPGDRARPAERFMVRTDELAFAYENPARWRYLLVFGADEHRRVYWFEPTWLDPSDNPRAIAIEAGAIRRELPTAMRHELTGTQLRLHFVFTSTPLSVRDIEAIVGAAPPLAAELAIPAPSAQSSQLLEVRP